MVDSYLEDITSEAEEEMAGTTAEDAADKEADGEAEEEEQEDRAEAEEEQIPQNLHGTGKNAMSRMLTSRSWKTRAPWPLRQSLTGGLISKPRC
jgi:septal ring factor EnvC (AmiA/AmiB activator)